MFWDHSGWASKDQVTISDPATQQVAFCIIICLLFVVLVPDFISSVSPIRRTSHCLYIFCIVSSQRDSFFQCTLNCGVKKKKPTFVFIWYFIFVGL